MKTCLLIVNPLAGKEDSQTYLQPLLIGLQPHFRRIEVRVTTEEGEIFSRARQACLEGADCVYVVGGDGSLNEAINGMFAASSQMGAEAFSTRFGFLPMGTANDFARALHVSINPDQAIRDLARIRWQPVDIGRVNDRCFINVVAVGDIPRAVNETSVEDKSRLGFMAYVRDFLRSAISQETREYRMTLDGRTSTIDTSMILVGLTNSVGSFENVIKNARVDDGLLHCLYLKEDATVVDGGSVVREFFFGDLSQSTPVVYQTARQIGLEPVGPDASDKLINVDGDTGPAFPLTIRLAAHPLLVMVPDSAPLTG